MWCVRSQDFLTAVLAHGRDFREFHKTVAAVAGKVMKQVKGRATEVEREKNRWECWCTVHCGVLYRR